jgi:UDP-2,3-diacylglucosamine hydrolase
MLDGKPARRTVLGDWYEHGSVLRCESGCWTLESIAIV